MNSPNKRRWTGPKQAPRPEVVSPFTDAPRLIVGAQSVREAVRAHGARVAQVLVEKALNEDGAGRLDALARFASDQGIAVERVERRALDALSGGAQHQGAAAWGPELALIEGDAVLGSPDPLIVALDGVQDPQNFGAVIRSAVALGATAVVWPEHSSAPLTPATFRASAGAVEHARLCRVPSLVRFLDDAVAASLQVVGLAAEGRVALHEMDLSGPTILVVGSEHAGLGRAVRQRCTALARLTLRGPIDSLNASVACAVSLYVASIHRAKTAT
jgi:23S rRNA (guanosine2251-2'-O)-methyltransferase